MGDVVTFKICNYAVSKSANEKELRQTFAGTLAYMAHKVLVKNADRDTLTDVWSLACVMVEILSGRGRVGGRVELGH
ncbi:unnamed protein product [Miscanthus lutarioriparius]|uniref:Protein kinase domain-containing protein n=1 Tax=Miscanthus lutarioriparius TaxID=422564 RepID=A0A811Q4X2_9POAL|nr:unnamed protein product [Miscanthus lutarioriparius]